MASDQAAKSSHCKVGNNSLRCMHCGDEEELPLPISIRVMAAMCEDFKQVHTRCKPSERGAARMRFSTPDEWLKSWDTGQSSLTIWNVMMGRPTSRPEVPRDPSDFGRCHRLLKAFPEWRARLAELAQFPIWQPLVDAWPRLEALYEEEVSSGEGSAPKLWEAMKVIACRD
jgi:hypothetical protein